MFVSISLNLAGLRTLMVVVPGGVVLGSRTIIVIIAIIIMIAIRLMARFVVTIDV